MAGRDPLLPPLDAEPGPSAARSRGELNAMRDRIVTRASARSAWIRSDWPRPLRVAAAFGAVLVMAGSSYAAIRAWPLLLSAPPPAPVAAPVPDPDPVPDPVPDPAPEPAPVVEPDSVADSHSDSVAASVSRPTGPRLDRLARANRLRAAQRWRAAEVDYVAVLESDSHPGARAAAALAAAELRLHHLGRARGALALFERALALEPASALAEQARHGVARAQRALGDHAREAGALRAFLRAHPASRMRAAAETRQRELERLTSP